jgi:iron complex transport system permease protein
MGRGTLIALCVVVTTLAALVSLKSGAVAVSLPEFAGLLLGSPDADAFQRSVVLNLRLPRVLFALIAGGALAICGATMQALFRNPLAEPGLVGLSAGAAVGAIVSLSVGGIGLLAVGPAGFAGALTAAFAAYAIGRHYPGVAGLLLAGIAINAFAMSLVGLGLAFATDAQLRSFTFWSLGSLTRANAGAVAWLAPWTLAWSLYLCTQWQALNALVLGERQARHLGFDPARVRRRAMVAIAMLIGPLVAMIGGIAFIGLVVPHMLRMWVGADHRVLLPVSWLGGATALLLADWAARVAVAPAELPVGVVTSLVGGPFFMWLLVRAPRTELSE